MALDLRQVDRAGSVRERQWQRWQAAGQQIERWQAGDRQAWLVFTAHGSNGAWRGAFDAGRWLHQQLPQLTTLLPAQAHAQAARQLFEAMERPFETAIADLDYQRLDDITVLSDADAGPALMGLHTPCGVLWLLQVPPPTASGPTPLPAWVREWPVCLRFGLGRIHLPVASVRRLTRGDLLVLAHPEHTLCLGELRIGDYTFDTEGLKMNIAEQPQPMPVETSLDDARVTLEVVLHQCSLSLAQLAEFESGHLLELDPAAAGEVRVLVNRKLLAVGELVQLHDCLAVEIGQLHRGLQDE